eukprot:3791422-Rhodomonas_salina.5
MTALRGVRYCHSVLPYAVSGTAVVYCPTRCPVLTSRRLVDGHGLCAAGRQAGERCGEEGIARQACLNR